MIINIISETDLPVDLEIVGIILFGPETADLGCFRVPVREDATLRPHNEKSSVQKHRGEEV